MKKFFNEPLNIVPEMLEGISLLRNDVLVLKNSSSIVLKAMLKEEAKNVVGLVSGGGSGHEPAHGGYVGQGGLSAAVCGQIYSSPTRDAILATINALRSDEVLLIVKNYTGDKINFGMAAELARATSRKRVEMVVVADDVALIDTQNQIGSRGIAGVVFVHKVAGAMAHKGESLERVRAIATKVANSTKTYGVSLSSCTIPSTGKLMFDIPVGMMEIGLGIHGEKGIGTQKLASADEVVQILIDKILEHIPPPQVHQPSILQGILVRGAPMAACPSVHPPSSSVSQTKIAVLLNNLGSTTQMEMAILARASIKLLRSRGYHVSRFYVGQNLTAMETAGVSISILPVDNEILDCLDAPTTMPGWSFMGTQLSEENDVFYPEEPIEKGILTKSIEKGPKDPAVCKLIKGALSNVCSMLTKQASFLTDLDSQVGDGDLGTNMEICSQAIMQKIADWNDDYPRALLAELAFELDTSLGGTSGPLYAIFFLNMAESIQIQSSLDRSTWVDGIEAGAKAISKLGGAHPGDRTMLDALFPFILALKQGASIEDCVKAAKEGSSNTSTMIAKRGRSSYLQERALGVVDPGSAAVALIVEEVVKSLI